MNRFSVLLVDDDREHVLEPAVNEFAGHSWIRLWVADNYDTAVKLLKSEFFHLALVDLRLHPTDDTNLAGLALLRKLRELRPSCERVLVTQNLGTSAEVITKEFHPVLGSAQGLMNKADLLHSFSHLIEHRLGRWRIDPIEVVGTTAVAATLDYRLARGRVRLDTPITADEVDFVVSRLFGQGKGLSQYVGPGISRVELDVVKKGFSPTAVVTARCISHSGRVSWSVLKLGERVAVEQMYVRYLRYIHYQVPLDQRVELLGCEFADNLGVLWFNFAGGSPDNTASLGDLYLQRSDRFFLALQDLLSPGRQAWYAESFVIDNLSEHFSRPPYHVDTVVVCHRLRDYLAELGQSFPVVLANQVTICGQPFELPSAAVFSQNVFHRKTPGCIVHGDLHCDNILVVPGDRVILIDYFDVGAGPRAVDFANLEGSVRLLDHEPRDEDEGTPRNDDDVIPELANLGDTERATWRAVWQIAGAPDGPPPPSEEIWAKASIYIGKLARNSYPNLTEEEYAATCLMWSMRLFKAKRPTSRQRMRLLVWMSSLVKVLKPK